MTINFNSLPTEKPSKGSVIPTGQYECKIVKAEMKQGNDPEKPPYLNVETDAMDKASSTSMGKFWFMLFESEAPLCRYQLMRFIKALNLPITGEFELKDLTKMVNGKSLLIDITPEERKDGKEPQRSVVDISADCFYPTNLASEPGDECPEVFVTPQGSAPVMSSY